MSIISNLMDKFGISASLVQADDFEKWLMNAAWSKYNDEKMNQRVVIENKVRSLDLHFSNGTVGKEYKAQIEIPFELVDDVWFDDVETLGLKYTVLDDLEVVETNTEATTELVVTDVKIKEESELTRVKDAEMVTVESATKEISSEVKTEVRHPEKFIIKITGKPTTPGDFIVKLCFKHKGWICGEPTTEIRIPIAFNPDPRSLWKNIPTSKDVIFYKPDSDSEYVKIEESEVSGPRKDIVAASQRGRSHAQEGKARDDHFKLYHCNSSDWYIIAVADGAGSAKYSRKGSEIACETVVEYCKEQLQNSAEFEEKIRAYKNSVNEEEARKQMANIIYTTIGNAAFKAHKNIKDAAVANEVNLKDLATTLMFAICKKFDYGWFVASFWVGDGAMCIFNENNKTFKLLGIPDEGEFSGQTRFLTMPEIFKDAKSVMDRLRFSIEEDFTALILMTDGISDPMFETENNLNSYDKWSEFWNKLKTGFSEDEIPGVQLTDDNEEAKDQLLRWMDFWSPGNHDDRTIAILY